MQSPESLRKYTAPNLKLKIGELLVDGEEIGVTDPSLGSVNFRFRLKFSKDFVGDTKKVVAETEENGDDA